MRHGRLLDWAHAAHKPFSGHVTFFEPDQRTARETVSFTAGQRVSYHESFVAGDGAAGAYVCQLTLASDGLAPGGPAARSRAAVASLHTLPMKQLLKTIPLLGPLARALKQRLFPAEAFTTSQAYWLRRYAQGGNSGAGSYHNLAEFKATVLNQFVAEHGIQTVLELGCGDGNQLRYFRFPAYTGFDISPVALAQCQALFKDDPSKQFFHVEEAAGHRAELALSLDVLYHLTEDDTYHAYMRRLFAAATSFVIIYSCDSDAPHNYAPHVRPRKFTAWVARHRPDFRLLAHIPNQFPLAEGKADSASTSFSDFFIYQKSGDADVARSPQEKADGNENPGLTG